jgi:hypothetical protein
MISIPKQVIPDSDLKKWTGAGWVFSAPAFTRGHSIVCWLKDGEPKEPDDADENGNSERSA